MRIIAGKHRGMVLKTFEAENIRPTLDRAREGIFNKIQFQIAGARVLDLFGGTGAISLEFLSRGADEVITCDNNPKSIAVIRENFLKAKENPNLIKGDYLECLGTLKNQRFDIIFLDPPFASDFGLNAIIYICNNNMLQPNGMIIYEHSSTQEIDYPSQVNLESSKKYGAITVDYLRCDND